jgi:outer membrane protein TolC
MRHAEKFFLGFMVSLSGWTAHAQSITYQDALTKAKDNNPSIRQLRLSNDSAIWQKRKAFSTFMPKLSLNGEHRFGEKYMLMPVEFGGNQLEMPVESPYTDFNIRAAYTLFEGFGGMNNYKAASLQERASELELRRAEFQLEREVRSRFYQALGAQTLAAVAGQRVKNLEEHLEQAKRYVKYGYTTSYDALRIEVQLAESKTEKIQADDNIVIAKNRLAQVMGLESLPEILAGDFPSIDKIAIPADLTVESQNRDDIQAKILREESAARLSAASKAWWSPKLNVYADKTYYNFTDRDVVDTDKYKDAYSVGVTLNWEIFDGGAAYASQHQAANQAKIAAEATRAAMIQLPQEFDLWKRKYSYSVSVYKSKTVSITQAQEAVRQATAGKRAGTRTVNDLLDSELELDMNKAKLVQSQIDAIEALGNLELASGRALY